eukprot:scaffold346296_cov22-Prasinocladus_malaysianus.AAC.1
MLSNELRVLLIGWRTMLRNIVLVHTRSTYHTTTVYGGAHYSAIDMNTSTGCTTLDVCREYTRTSYRGGGGSAAAADMNNVELL